MMSTKPPIDILMATYNGERFVGEQIESIQGQTYENWRLLVSDDCSNDKTLDVVRRYAAEDKRIQVVSQDVKYGGAKGNFFALMKKSGASYVMFCDQDDVWLPKKVEKTLYTMREIEESANADAPLLVFTDMKVVDGQLGVIAESFEEFSAINPTRTSFQQVVAQSLGAGCTMMVNAAARDLALEVQNTDDVIMHDWWLTLLASAFGRIGYLDEPTSLYRQHGFNEIGALEYSPVKRASHFDAMKKSVADTVLQARSFSRCYGDLLSDEQLKCIKEFVASGESRGIPSVFHLVASGCWKKGLRKAGQVAVVLSGAGVDNDE